MQKVFFETGFLDNQAKNGFGLSEDILMENAAVALESALTKILKKRIKKHKKSFVPPTESTILIVCGSGNNGGDGYALARRIHCKKIDKTHTLYAAIYEAKPPKSPACILQAERASHCRVPLYHENVSEVAKNCAVIVDCLFGSGLSGKPDKKSEALLGDLTAMRAHNRAFYLACDIPSGLTASGESFGAVFEADLTVTMGAYKVALLSDSAKDCTGKIIVADLGISRAFFEAAENPAHNNASTNTDNSHIFLLEKTDVRLPIRKKQNVHKGIFGHVAIFSGEKSGASVLACQAACTLGAGLVTAIHGNVQKTDLCAALPSPIFSPEIMHSNHLPAGTTALCAGMGLGRESPYAEQIVTFARENPNVPCVFDADLLYHAQLPALLKGRENLILTPHPKEFSALLKLCGLGTFSIQEIAARRFELAAVFCSQYAGCVLLLKGANALICKKNRIFINTFGTNNLAKGGSGDILAGFITALLAQGYSSLEAAIIGSLIHALAARKYSGTYSLSPQDIFKSVQRFERDF